VYFVTVRTRGADDGELLVADREGAIENIGRAAERLPPREADDRGARLLAGIGVGEEAPGVRAHAEHCEEAAGDGGDPTLRPAFRCKADIVDAPIVDRRDRRHEVGRGACYN
jgi:hypothetical protein